MISSTYQVQGSLCYLNGAGLTATEYGYTSSGKNSPGKIFTFFSDFSDIFSKKSFFPWKNLLYNCILAVVKNSPLKPRAPNWWASSMISLRMLVVKATDVSFWKLVLHLSRTLSTAPFTWYACSCWNVEIKNKKLS